MVWCGPLWCGINYTTRFGVGWSGGACYAYGLVWTSLVRSVMVYGLGQPGLVQSCYGLAQSGPRWWSPRYMYGNGGGVDKQYN